MRLSALQKYILVELFKDKKDRFSRSKLLDFYKDKGEAKRELQTKIITKSIESLIDKELMIGYGVRTPHKWFIKQVSLTQKGKQLVKKMLDRQQELPLRKRKASKR